MSILVVGFTDMLARVGDLRLAHPAVLGLLIAALALYSTAVTVAERHRQRAEGRHHQERS